MDVSVIIVNYNTKQLTIDCIESVFLHTHDLLYEVIVVDNASTDGSVELFKQDSRIIFVESSKNLGFGRANNLGYKYSSGKYIFLLNSDTILLNNAVKLFFDWMECNHKRIACVGSPLLNIHKCTMHSFGYFPSLYNISVDVLLNYFSFLRKEKGIPIFKKGETWMPVNYVTGADLFIRRSVIENFGMFDPDYFMYYEETDMQYRYYQHGYISALISTPQIIHLCGASGMRGRSLRKLRVPWESCKIFAKKHFSSFQYRIVCVILYLLIPKILLYPDSWQEKKRTLKTLFM